MTKTLTQIVEILRGADGSGALIEHMDELLEFSQEVDSVASDILGSKSEEYLLGMLSIIQSLAMTIMIDKGMSSPMQAIMMAQDHQMSEYAALIMKLTIGISTMEELR